mmetsp:Transcript_5070/g.16237  ORF Transcript_5070/g.16237 Transcript_5070/m.16237 type:complete len:326 (-) Transcript_5070:176-1153(-)
MQLGQSLDGGGQGGAPPSLAHLGEVRLWLHPEEGLLVRRQLEDHRRPREDVGLVRVWLAECDLRRHVAQRAGLGRQAASLALLLPRGALPQLAEPKVHQHDSAAPREPDVGRLEVAVQEAVAGHVLVVAVAERASDLQRNVEPALHRPPLHRLRAHPRHHVARVLGRQLLREGSLDQLQAAERDRAEPARVDQRGPLPVRLEPDDISVARARQHRQLAKQIGARHLAALPAPPQRLDGAVGAFCERDVHGAKLAFAHLCHGVQVRREAGASQIGPQQLWHRRLLQRRELGDPGRAVDLLHRRICAAHELGRRPPRLAVLLARRRD